tara:strand:+ start:227 stop:460 length:234 start_codon:yes stop_codon:yes gene_type:complete
VVEHQREVEIVNRSQLSQVLLEDQVVEEVLVVQLLDQEGLLINQVNQEIQDHLVKVLLEEMLLVQVIKVAEVVVLAQ